MKRPASRARICGLVAMRRVSAIRESRASGFSALDARWRRSAPACRTRRPRPAPRAPGRRSFAISRLDVPGAEVGREPDVVPAAKRRVGVGVMAREPRAQVGRLDRRRAPSRCSRPRSPRRTGAARPRPRRAAGWRAACSSAIEPPSLWPKSQGRSMPTAREERGQHLVGLAVHEVGRPALVARLGGRAAVAVAREHEAGEAVRVAELAREVLPHRDRAQALVQEHDQRRGAARARRPTRTRCSMARPRQSTCAPTPRPATGALTTRRSSALALAQAKALDLAGRRLRQLVDELDRARVLVGGEPFLDEGLERRRRSPPAPGLRTTKALVLVRPSPSSVPMTAHSSTAGCCISVASTSNGETQMPLTLSMSSLRPE